MFIQSHASIGASRLAGIVAIVVVGGCATAAPTPAVSTPGRSSAAVAPSPVATSGTTSSDPVITVQPAEAQIGDPVSIRLSGLPPGHEVTVRATTVGLVYPDLEDSGTVRESSATFRTDATGAVDLAAVAPLSGSYSIANPMWPVVLDDLAAMR